MNEPTLRNARLPDGRVVDISVAEGRISGLSPSSTAASATAEVKNGEGSIGDDLSGWLLLPALVEPHAHLDKVLTAEAVPNPKGDLPGAIEAWAAAAAAGRFSPDDVRARATAALERLLVHGVTAVRTHINVTAEVGATNVRVLRGVRDEFAGLLDLQLVALTGAPMVGEAGRQNRHALEAAVEEGIDVVGGVPHLEHGEADSVRHAFEIAADAGLDIDLHTDETLDASVLTVREMARCVHTTSFGGRVAASHCVSLGVQPPDVQLQVAREIAEAGIAVLPQPQTNLYLQGRDDAVATPRGLTALGALAEAGALVAAGADNVQDPYNLVGRSDPLETAALLVMAGHQLPDDAYDMVSNNGRVALGLEPIGFEVGDPADFVAIDAPSIRGAIADAPMARRTYRRGRLVASADQTVRIHRGAP